MVLLDTGHALPLVATTATAGVLYYIFQFIEKRRFYRNLPCAPHSFFWGHIKLVGKYMAKMPAGGYIQQTITQMKQDYDLPEVFYVDMWPVGPSLVIMSSPEAAAYPTTTNVWPMAQIVADFFAPTAGLRFIEATNGPLWKELLHRLAPGLTRTVIKNYFQVIVNEACKLRDEFGKHISPDAAPVNMKEAVSRYPSAVISEVLFGEPLSGGLYSDTFLMVELVRLLQNPAETFLPWKKWRMQKNLAKCVERIDAEIRLKIRVRFATLQQDKSQASQTLVDRLLLPHIQCGLALDAELEELCLANLKGLSVAGIGTTTDTTTYAWLLLHSHPETLAKLREEHDRVFGTDLDETIVKLRSNPRILDDLDYTAAVINETLRLYPIAMVVRAPPPGVKTITLSGKDYPILPEHLVCIHSHSMHYNPEYFPDPKRFNPGRFLASPPSHEITFISDDTENISDSGDNGNCNKAKPSSSPSAPPYPRSAYRPFERGPRGCIGQTLAMEEMKVQLVVLARTFDMEAVSARTESQEEDHVAGVFWKHTDLEGKLGKHTLQESGFSASPSGPVLMKMRRAAVVTSC